MKTTDIDCSVGGTKYIGYLAVDEARAGKRPGGLLAPRGEGRGEGALSVNSVYVVVPAMPLTRRASRVDLSPHWGEG